MLELSYVPVWSGIPVSEYHEAAKPIMGAFESLWRVGVVHNDVHAGNVCVQRIGELYQVTIFDLGHAQVYPDGQVPEAVVAEEREQVQNMIGMR